MVTEIVQVLRDAGELTDSTIEDHEIEEKYLDAEEAILKKTQIMDSLEYGRAVHAEMAAITSAARQGVSLSGANLYCTTFPCHNCAKHIVASGIRTVYYLEPYAKSFADDLYPDSISIDVTTGGDKIVQFRQFVGITPNRFKVLFAKEKLKDSKGNVKKWRPKESQPVLEKLDQAHISREIAFQKDMLLGVDAETALYLGFSE